MASLSQPSPHSLRYRDVAVRAWSEVVRPHLEIRYPGLIPTAFYAVGSSVAYGLADEHSDIDTVLILPLGEYERRGAELADWAYHSPELAASNLRMQVELNVKVSTWQREVVGVVFDGDGSWGDFYNGHQHWAMTLIPIHDPLRQMQVISASQDRMPDGLATRAAEQFAGQLADLRRAVRNLSIAGQERFLGLLSYSIASRTLPYLYHRSGAPLPFHKWQWPLAEHLGEDSKAILRQLRAMLEGQAGDVAFPDGLIREDVRAVPSRTPPLPTGVRLPPDAVEKALASVQWHLSERGGYQMIRARARGWHEAALQYMCATRCLLIKGAILLETGRIACGEDVRPAWDQVGEHFPGLEALVWPSADGDPFQSAIDGIYLFRRALEDRRALPQQYLDVPLSSPASYELACVLEEL